MAGKETTWLTNLRNTLEAMNKVGATELDFNDDHGHCIVIRRRTRIPSPGESPVVENTSNYEDETRYSQIKAPFTGVLYRGPEPGKEPYYAMEGDFLEESQTVAMIEAMKLINEIKATRPGKLIKIFCQDGAVVNRGDVLMVLDITQIPNQRP